MERLGLLKSSADTVVAFRDLPADATAIAGGKGASLSRMAAAGLPVPPGFVIAAAAFQHFLRSCGGLALIERVTTNLDVEDACAVEHAAGAIRAMIVSTPLPAPLADEILAAHGALHHREFVAVRSSAVSEDGLTASFAGQQESYLNVRGDAVLDRVRECWASFFSARALFYRAQKAVLGDTRMAVVVQEMVQADTSGVMFTVDPIRNRRDCMVIEGAPGLGEAIVSGEVTPDHYVIARDDGAVIETFIPEEDRGRAVSDAELQALRDIGLRIEAFFGCPQDVEWCIRGGELLVLQSRPITTLGEKKGSGGVFPAPEVEKPLPTPFSLSPLIQLGRLWVIEHYPYNSTHLLKSLEWVDRLAPDASEAVRLATLTHDMERAFGGPDAIPIKMHDRAYEEAHSNRSARIVGEWLRANGASVELAADVESLIRVHEWGGSPDANLVQAADSLSFLETNIDLMLGFAKTGRFSRTDIALKFDQMFERIQVPTARELARPMWQQAKARLEAL
jgi:pyruvate,water dikinase